MSLRDVRIDRIADAAIGLRKHQFRKFAGVDFRRLLADGLGGSVEQIANCCDLGRGPARGFVDRLQHEQDPILPRLIGRDLQQPAVIVGLVADDVSAEIENRKLQDPFLDEKQQIEHAACAAVSIRERVDGFELIVRERHADEGIGLFVLAQLALPVRQEIAKSRLTFGRRVNHLSGPVVRKGGAITQGLVCCRVGLRLADAIREAEQTVGRREDVFDFRARLRFEERDCIDEDGLIGDEVPPDLEFCESCSRFNTSLEDGSAFPRRLPEAGVASR